MLCSDLRITESNGLVISSSQGRTGHVTDFTCDHGLLSQGGERCRLCQWRRMHFWKCSFIILDSFQVYISVDVLVLILAVTEYEFSADSLLFWEYRGRNIIWLLLKTKQPSMVMLNDDINNHHKFNIRQRQDLQCMWQT